MLLYHRLNYAILIGPMRVTWCAKSKQCCPVLLLQHYVPGEHGVNHVTPCICVDLLSKRSIRQINILCCCVMDDDINLLHLFYDILVTKQILTVSLDQHWKIMPRSCAISDCYTDWYHLVFSSHSFHTLSLRILVNPEPWILSEGILKPISSNLFSTTLSDEPSTSDSFISNDFCTVWMFLLTYLPAYLLTYLLTY